MSTEETKPVLDTTAPALPVVEPKFDGHLGYNAPGNFLKDLLPIPPKKQYFWFGSEEGVPADKLSHYLAAGKPHFANATAAWSEQTGKGLLYFSKHGEKKDVPTGVLNLAEAEEIKESGEHDISFKLHGHKHKFSANNAEERSGWVASIKKVSEEAKALKATITESEGYKAALEKLSKPSLAVPKPESVAKKSTEVKPEGETPAESTTEEAKKSIKARSRSRGKPGSVFGSLFKKDEAKPEEAKKEEEAKPAETTEAAPVVEAPVATESETAAGKLDWFAASVPGSDLPAEPAAEAAPAAETPAADAAAPAEAAAAAEEPKEEAKDVKAGRRVSRWEGFFKKADKPKEVETPAAAPAPTVVEPETAAPTEPAEGAAGVLPLTEAPAVPAPAAEEKPVTPTKERKPSLFSTLRERVRSPSAEHPPVIAAPAAAEAPKVDDATPKVDEAAPTDAPVETAPTGAPAETEAPTNGETTSPPETKRRSSFFALSSLKHSLKKPVEAASAAAPTTATETEEAKPAEEAAKSAEAEATEPEVKAAPKEKKDNPVAKILRKTSIAIRGNKEKKEVKAPTKVDETTEPAAEAVKPVEEPTKAEETAAPAEEKKEEEKPAAPVVPETAPTVSATA
ncbi:hypothetical protein EJ06DRAFT_383777 [Trichodelitschia bisporula]|uniref:Meiotic expression up-regulated protein 6 PH domain-containing protein n=1 Tax=Trichodelitschia bisporula TaxID=703511 RepID=A0A6G1HYV7_9PEZI|nr:hypothetical protein EJ06DRAFT_383777 [Trichodelitschia bisporula]